MVKIIPVPPQEVPAVFPNVKHLLEKALSYSNGEWTIDDVYHNLLKLKTILWVTTDEEYNIHSALIAEVVQYPRKKIIRILLAGGKELDEWKKETTDAMVLWCKNIGANGLEVIGRKGWERALGKQGFKYAHTVLLKEI